MATDTSKSKKSAQVSWETCETCGAELKGWPKDKKIFHCEGSALAVGCLKNDIHHTAKIWPKCWNCGGHMGCPICVTSRREQRVEAKKLIIGGPLDLVCRECLVQANRESLLAHGPVSNDSVQRSRRGGKMAPMLHEYPDSWVVDFMATHPEWDTSLDGDEAALMAYRKARDNFLAKKVPAAPTRNEIRHERDQQVAALADKSQYNNPEITDFDLPENI